MSQIRLHGFDPSESLLEWSPRPDQTDLLIGDLQDILDEQAGQIALILLPGLQYYNGQLLDMQKLCYMAARVGCRIGLDLAHAIGNLPLQLHDWAPDFAAWCSYKYLNSGPGAIAGAFIAARHLGGDGSEQLLGWWGHEEKTRLKMSTNFKAEEGADRWQLSCPTVLSLAPLLASLELFEKAGIDRLRGKSLDLTGYLEFLLRSKFQGKIKSITPSDARGAQLSIVVIAEGVEPKRVLDRLEAQNVVVDWREPNVIRVAPAPLYNSYEDVFEFAVRLNAALGD